MDAAVASLWERIYRLLRDVRWILSVASRPDEGELAVVSRLLLLLVFVAGVFQLFFHVAYVYMTGAAAMATLEPVSQSVAIMSSLVVILALMIYLMFRLR